MEDFFSKLKKSIDKGTAIVSVKSTTIIETTKLKQDISTTKRLKRETFTDLGKKIYEMNKEGEVNLESVEPLFTRITEMEAKIEDLKAKIQIFQDEEKAKMDDINADGSTERPMNAEFKDVTEEETEDTTQEETTEEVIIDVEIINEAEVEEEPKQEDKESEKVEDKPDNQGNVTGEYHG